MKKKNKEVFRGDNWCIYIYIYIYRERERERERPLLNWKRKMEEFLKMTADIIYTYIYIYIYFK